VQPCPRVGPERPALTSVRLPCAAATLLQMPRDHADSARHLRDDHILALFCRHRDQSDLARASDLWELLAIRNADRVRQIVHAFRFPGGQALPHDDREDAAQEAFLRVVAMGASFRGAELGQFRAALVRCVRNACMDYGRKLLRHDQHAAGSLDERFADGEAAGPYDGAIARHSLDRALAAADDLADEERRLEAHDLVAWAVGEVEHDSNREVLELTLFAKLPADEIADRLGISMDNVYARRSRGMKRLEEILRDHGSRPHP
jgi:RNA polymerase sigma factor (sigma-70 family)